MKIVSRSKNVSDEEADFAYDVRLARRWKRRRIAYENLRIKSRSNKRLKKTIYQNNQNNEALAPVDRDSKTFLDDLGMFVGVNGDAWCVDCADGNDGDDKVSDVLDPQYMMYLSNLTEIYDGVNSDARCVDYADGNDGDDKVSDVLDPQYTTFLGNLKEDDRSYVLELALSDERSIVVQYEKEDGSNNGLDVENLETTKCCRNEKKTRTENIFRNYAEREKIESPRSLSSDLGRENTENPIMVSKSNLGRKRLDNLGRLPRTSIGSEKSESRRRVLRRRRFLRNKSGRKKIESLNVTLSSNLGTENTESPGKILRGKSNRNNNERTSIVHDVVKKEKTEGQKTSWSNSRRQNNESPSIMHDVVKKEKTESQRTSCSNSRRENNEKPSMMYAVKREKIESHITLGSKSRKENNKSPSIMQAAVKREKPEGARTLRNVLRRESLGTRKNIRKPVLVKNVDMEAEHYVSYAENGCSNKRHSSKATTNLAKEKSSQGGKSDLLNANHLKFLKFVKDGKHLLYEPEGGKEVLCEESDSDSEVVLLDNDPFSDGNYTPFVDVDGESCVEILTGRQESHFREKVMEFLRKPYDRMEYKMLSLEASRLRPLEDDGDFPGDLPRRRRSCGLDFNGKSYLDEYGDLASLIVQAQHDRRRILNLLRGFFYWLQNLVHEGAFKPWLDSSCLSILPH